MSKKINPKRKLARSMLSADEMKGGVNPFDGRTWEDRKERRNKKQLAQFHGSRD